MVDKMKKVDNKVKKVSNEMNIENGHLVTFAQKRDLSGTGSDFEATVVSLGLAF